MSRTHFFRWCRRIYDQTPGERLVALRMRRAKVLLRNMDYPIALIGELVGYTDAFAFSTAFKRHTGFSPRDYRQVHTVRVQS